jgi:LAO/AO transport system kinase
MTGIEAVWNTILEHARILGDTGEIEAKRKKQNIDALRFLVKQGLKEWFFKKPYVQDMIPLIEKEVEQGGLAPTTAADKFLSLLDDY